jgi:hypothetical protein
MKFKINIGRDSTSFLWKNIKCNNYFKPESPVILALFSKIRKSAAECPLFQIEFYLNKIIPCLVMGQPIIKVNDLELHFQKVAHKIQ